MLVIGDISALWFWRCLTDAPRSRLSAFDTRKTAPSHYADTLEKPTKSLCERVFRMFPDIFYEPLHVMVTRKEHRARASWCHPHVFENPVPARYVVMIAPDIGVVSPEWLFVQAGTKLRWQELTLLGCELAGRYRLMPSQSQGFIDGHPLVSVIGLRQVVEAATGVQGVKNAVRAVPHVREGARSPMESRLAAFLSIRCSSGGMGYKGYEVNKRIEVPAAYRPMIGGGRYLECDLLFPESGLVVEYDGEEFHTGAQRIAEDAARRNVLAALGYKQYVLTRQQLRMPGEFRAFLRMLDNEVTGLSEEESARRWPKRDDLWKLLFRSNKALLGETW